MKNEYFTFAGIALSGIGLILGIALSSSVPSSPAIFGTAIGVYAAVAAAVVGGIRKGNSDLSRH